MWTFHVIKITFQITSLKRDLKIRHQTTLRNAAQYLIGRLVERLHPNRQIHSSIPGRVVGSYQRLQKMNVSQKQIFHYRTKQKRLKMWKFWNDKWVIEKQVVGHFVTPSQWFAIRATDKKINIVFSNSCFPFLLHFSLPLRDDKKSFCCEAHFRATN